MHNDDLPHCGSFGVPTAGCSRSAPSFMNLTVTITSVCVLGVVILQFLLVMDQPSPSCIYNREGMMRTSGIV